MSQNNTQDTDGEKDEDTIIDNSAYHRMNQDVPDITEQADTQGEGEVSFKDGVLQVALIFMLVCIVCYSV